MSYRTKKLSDEICDKAQKYANYFPVDRPFLAKYVDEILKQDNVEFIYSNLENLNNTYTVQLFCCLPELWENITYSDLLTLIGNFTNIHSFYTFIEFTYKYIGIDTIDIVLKSDRVSDLYKDKLQDFLSNQYINLIMDDDTLSDFREDILGIDYASFEYIKQKMLLDNRIEPSEKTGIELKNRLKKYRTKA